MNKLKSIIAIVACASLFGCVTLQNIQEVLGTPAAVQSEITILGALAKPRISADAQAKIHYWATEVNKLADLNLDSIFALIPPTGSQNADALIAAAKAYLVSTAQKYGENNQTFIAYVRAIMNGLLANF